MTDHSHLKTFVAGWPISHSMSPLMHGFWIEQFGLNASYEPIAVEPGNLEGLVQRIRDGEFRGGNVTIPHKQDIVAFADQKTPLVDLLGAANTIWMEDNNLCLTNTDAYGFSANLTALAADWKTRKHALVLGAGGASRAVVYALLEAGIANIDISNRNTDRAKEVCARFDKMASERGCNLTAQPLVSASEAHHDLIINTTALGMVGQPPLIMDVSKAAPNTIVTDIVYNPLETGLLRAAKLMSLQTVDGLGMLLHQAVPGFEKWFAHRPAVSEELRSNILSAMGAPTQ